ncbi:MAG: hypothetical protein J6B30_09175 [Muribaculaceae bacterium]|nr:hypothetical protein [Muribaculaceae bacterium]
MKAKIVLLLSIMMLASVNAFAWNDYKGSINEKQAKKAKEIEFRIPGDFKVESEYDKRGYILADSKIIFHFMDKERLHIMIADAGDDRYSNYGHISFYTPYIKNIEGKIIIFGNSYCRLKENEPALENYPIFITIEPVIEGRYATYFFRVYKDSMKSDPVVEKPLYSCKFIDKNHNYRDAESIAEGLEYVWLWLENRFK